jgi:tetratricopeptide (TPR) repeat protein
VRITVQLIHATTDTHLWAGSYERDFRDVLALQGEVAQAVAREIKAALTPEEATRLVSAPAVSPKAYEAYLKGQFHWYKLSPGHLDRALSYFQLALEEDRNCALAQVGIANVWLVRADAGFMPPGEAFPKARAAVLKALELDGSLAEGHIALANITALYDRDWPAGEREFRRAIELNPNSADGHFMYADFLISMKRPREWAVEMQPVLELDPLNPFFQCFYGWHLVYLDQCDDAILQFRESLAADPGFPSAHLGLWGAYYRKRMDEEALEEAVRFFAALGDDEVRESLRRGCTEGSYSRAMQLGAEILVKRSRSCHVPGVRIARLYAHAGEKDRAMEWLQRAVEKRETPLMHLSVAWDWDVLRGDPRFRDLLHRVGLPE